MLTISSVVVRLTLLILSASAHAEVLYEQQPRSAGPNGILLAGGFSAADDFMLSADAIAIGGGLWTYEAATTSPDSTLRYAFWLDADLANPAATAPSGKPLPSKSGTATVLSKVPSAPVNIGGLSYTPYKYVFEFAEMITLLSGIPYWLSFHFGDGVGTSSADFLWAYSDTFGVPVQATANAFTPSVAWAAFPSSSTAFNLRGFSDAGGGGALFGTSSVPMPVPALLMLPGVLWLARRGFRERRHPAARTVGGVH